MEIIFSEKYSYAEIGIGKNYSSIGKSHEIKEGLDIDALFSNKVHSFNLRPKYESKGVFFHSGSVVDEEYIKFRAFTFFTNKDRHIKRHFSNPFSSINISNGERRIVRNGDVITIKLYRNYKHRSYNKVFFKCHKKVVTFSFNTKTGNFLYYKFSDKKKEYKVNSFLHLMDFLSYEMFSLKPQVKGHNIPSFDDYLFIENLCTIFGFPKPSTNENLKDFLGNTFYQSFVSLFITKKRIKVPNHNVDYLLHNFYPTEKFFKKNDRKLISSVLDMLSIKSKFTIKICHQYPD